MYASDIAKQCIETAPELKHGYFAFDSETNIDDMIGFKQTIKIPKEDYDQFFGMFPMATRRLLRQPISSNKEVEDLSEMTESYDHCEYYGNYDECFISNQYVDFIRKYQPEYIYVNVYNIRNKNLPDILKKYVLEEPSKKLPFVYQNELGPQIKYSYFGTKVYNIIEIDGNVIPYLYVDLPYEYYKDIEAVDLVAYYDINKEDFGFSGTESKGQIELVKDIAENGLYEPLMLKIKNGTVLGTKECHSRFAAAKMLKLPTIPVCLFMANFTIDLLENRIKIKDDKSMINEICSPYFTF